MKIAVKTLSYIGLGLTVIPSFFVLSGQIAWGTHARLMLAGTLLWFATAPFWIKKRS